jgi:hypothetical protein
LGMQYTQRKLHRSVTETRRCEPKVSLMTALTVYGVAVLSFMMLMYALEGRGSRFILGFALGCLLSSVYGFLSGTWPFGVVEAVWCLIAARRFALARARP